MATAKRLLLIDLDDHRRASRVQLLTATGYEVDVRKDYVEAERLEDPGSYDLVIIALHTQPAKAALYSNRLRKAKPRLPILLLTDLGVFAPHGTLSRSVETGNPAELMKEIAAMLAGSTHVRELPDRDE